jgi:hypothetical protein
MFRTTLEAATRAAARVLIRGEDGYMHAVANVARGECSDDTEALASPDQDILVDEEGYADIECVDWDGPVRFRFVCGSLLDQRPLCAADVGADKVAYEEPAHG